MKMQTPTGETVPFPYRQTAQRLEYACRGIKGVSPNDVLAEALPNFQEITSQDSLTNQLIRSTVERIERSPAYYQVACRLRLYTLYDRCSPDWENSSSFEDEYRRLTVSKTCSLLEGIEPPVVEDAVAALTLELDQRLSLPLLNLLRSCPNGPILPQSAWFALSALSITSTERPTTAEGIRHLYSLYSRQHLVPAAQDIDVLLGSPVDECLDTACSVEDEQPCALSDDQLESVSAHPDSDEIVALGGNQAFRFTGVDTIRREVGKPSLLPGVNISAHFQDNGVLDMTALRDTVGAAVRLVVEADLDDRAFFVVGYLDSVLKATIEPGSPAEAKWADSLFEAVAFHAQAASQAISQPTGPRYEANILDSLRDLERDRGRPFDVSYLETLPWGLRASDSKDFTASAETGVFPVHDACASQLTFACVEQESPQHPSYALRENDASGEVVRLANHIQRLSETLSWPMGLTSLLLKNGSVPLPPTLKGTPLPRQIRPGRIDEVRQIEIASRRQKWTQYREVLHLKDLYTADKTKQLLLTAWQKGLGLVQIRTRQTSTKKSRPGAVVVPDETEELAFR